VGVLRRLLAASAAAAAVDLVGGPTGEDGNVPTLHLLKGGRMRGREGREGREGKEEDKECSLVPSPLLDV